MTKTEIKAMAKELEATLNPYKAQATLYYIGKEIRYLWNGTSYTEQELTDAYIETAMHDIKNGYNERMVGYYDKWYRYSHADEGRAYDAGCKKACENPKCSEEFHIIPCIH